VPSSGELVAPRLGDHFPRSGELATPSRGECLPRSGELVAPSRGECFPISFLYRQDKQHLATDTGAYSPG
jgi:hypothetical protein